VIAETFGLGQPVRRTEDPRLLTGRGCYTDDLVRPGMAQMAILRSPHAHARIRGIDTAAARAAPGVLLVLTGADAEADGLGLFPVLAEVPEKPGTPPLRNPPRRILTTDVARYVGDPVAIVVAETRAQAMDAAELVEVAWEPLPALAETGAAFDATAPLVWPELGSNLCVHWAAGDEAAAAAAFAEAPHVVALDLVQNRLYGSPMEPRVALGEVDAEGRLVLHAPTQGVIRVREGLAKHVFRLPNERIRVVSTDVGGGFGVRGKVFPESAMVLWAARRLGRPVKWLAGRMESFLADPHARDHVTRAEMALDADGRIRAIRIATLANMGAYLCDFGPRIATLAGGRIAGTVYDIPLLDLQVRCVFTHSVPTDAYRGAGRPEAAFAVERLLDLAAARLGLGRDEIRRRNFIAPERIPYTNAAGAVIDSGRFAEVQAKALALADWEGFPARRAEAASRSVRRGIGLGCFIEASGGGPAEWSRVVLDAEARARVHVGTFSHGQGHATVFAQLAHARLGLPFADIALVQGDTEVIARGGGTGGSRSSQMAGVAILRASDLVLAKARRIAAHLLEAGEADVVLQDGAFVVAGTDLRVTWREVARTAADPARLPDGLAPGLDEQVDYRRPTECNFPNGCHVVEVEVDPESGRVAIARYTAVDDVGVVMNPMIVHGQAHGAIATGIGQALLEHARYDPESGQFLSASFQDYALPRAADLPAFQLGFHVVPNPANELGVKGAGEGGSCGAPPALVSALCDAIGVPHLDMPLTPEAVWRACNG
jgi:carbon-monoxide dehydrogenase large subunit